MSRLGVRLEEAPGMRFTGTSPASPPSSFHPILTGPWRRGSGDRVQNGSPSLVISTEGTNKSSMLQRGFCHLSQGIRNSCSRRLRVWSQTPLNLRPVCLFMTTSPATHTQPPITYRTAYSHNTAGAQCWDLDRDSLWPNWTRLSKIFWPPSQSCLCVSCIAQSQQRMLLAKSVWWEIPHLWHLTFLIFPILDVYIFDSFLWQESLLSA